MNIEKTVIDCLQLAELVRKIRERDTNCANVNTRSVSLNSMQFASHDDAVEIADKINLIIKEYTAKYLSIVEKKLLIKFSGVDIGGD